MLDFKTKEMNSLVAAIFTISVSFTSTIVPFPYYILTLDTSGVWKQFCSRSLLQTENFKFILSLLSE